jgi:hypothetical protein
MSDLLRFSDELKLVLGYLPALLDFEKVAAEHAADIDRLKSDKARMVESYKTQARAELKPERDAVLAEAEAQARKIKADAEEYADKRRAETKSAEKETVQARAELARLEARIAEFHRVRAALAG